MTETPNIPWYGPVLWIAGLFAVSAVYRYSAGKPVIFFSVPNAIFLQCTASGFSDDAWWRRLGGARNCLVVAIVDGRLIIRPFTPFNLLFLPEIYGLECDVPLLSVVRAHQHRWLLSSGVRVEFRDPDGTLRAFGLLLRHPEDFLRHFPPQAASA